MANDINVFAKVMQEISPTVLRQICIMPRMAGKNLDSIERERKGSVINFTRHFDSTVRDVTPASYAPAATDELEASNVPVTLNRFKESNFILSDKEFREIQDNMVLPGRIQSAIKALAYEVEDYLMETAILSIPNRVGTIGTAPTDLQEISEAVAEMNRNGAEQVDWMMALDSTYAASLRNNGNMLNSEVTGTFEGLRSGFFGTIFNFETLEAPRLGKNSYYSITTGTHASNTAVNLVAGYSRGDAAVAVDGGTGTAKKGETFSFAGHDQKYVVLADVADLSAGTITFAPQLKEAVANDEAITFDVAASTTYKVYGIGMAQECQSFVARPFESGANGQDMDEIATIVDPMTGIILRLSKIRGYKQTSYSLDILYGGAVVEANNGVLIIA